MRLGLLKRTVSLLTVVRSTDMAVWSRALAGRKINAVLKEASSEETPKPTARPSRAPHGVRAESRAKPRGSFHFSPNLLSAKGSYKHLHWGKLQQCAEAAPETEQTGSTEDSNSRPT